MEKFDGSIKRPHQPVTSNKLSLVHPVLQRCKGNPFSCLGGGNGGYCLCIGPQFRSGMQSIMHLSAEAW